MADPTIPQLDQRSAVSQVPGFTKVSDADFRSGVTVYQKIPHYRYPQNIGQPPFDKWIKFSAKSGRHILRNLPLAEDPTPDWTLASVGLYLTESALASDTASDWGETSVNAFGAAAMELFAQTGRNLTNARLSNPMSVIDAVKGGLRDVAATLAGTSATNVKEQMGSIIEHQVREHIDGITGGAAALFTGAKANPRTDILFDSVKYRTHEMSFMLVPRSLAEAQAIDNIIHFFQFYMLPAYLSTAEEKKARVGAFLLGYPYEFTIDLLSTNGVTNSPMEHVNKIGRSVLTGLSIDHAAGGKTAFVKDNGDFYPVATAIKVCFQEVRLLARDSDEIKRGGTETLNDPRGSV